MSVNRMPIKAEKSSANTVFLLGEMTAGKDFFGSLLIERGYTRIAFADALKEEVAAKHGVTVDELNADKAKYRPELQSHGAMRRKENINYWVDRFNDKRLRNPSGLAVCTDCRHLNEASYAVRDVENSLIIRIWTPWEVRQERIKTLYGSVPDDLHKHPSEVEVAQCPFNIRVLGNLSKEDTLTDIFSQYAYWVRSGKPIYKEVLNLKMR